MWEVCTRTHRFYWYLISWLLSMARDSGRRDLEARFGITPLRAWTNSGLAIRFVDSFIHGAVGVRSSWLPASPFDKKTRQGGGCSGRSSTIGGEGYVREERWIYSVSSVPFTWASTRPMVKVVSIRLEYVDLHAEPLIPQYIVNNTTWYVPVYLAPNSIPLNAIVRNLG